MGIEETYLGDGNNLTDVAQNKIEESKQSTENSSENGSSESYSFGVQRSKIDAFGESELSGTTLHERPTEYLSGSTVLVGYQPVPNGLTGKDGDDPTIEDGKTDLDLSTHSLLNPILAIETGDLVSDQSKDGSYTVDDFYCEMPRSRKGRSKNPREVDGAYGWVVTFVGFIILMFSGGVFYSGGIIVPEIVSALSGSESVAATLILSLKFASMNFFCLFAGCMTEVYGCQLVSILGGVFVVLGFITSSFVRNLGILYLTYSLFLGFGLSLQFVPCIVVVQQYFTKRRALASGLLNAGSSVGVFIFSVLIRWLIDNYYWHGTLLLMAGINLNGLPLSWLLQKPQGMDEEEPGTELSGESKKVPGFLQNIKVTFATLLVGIKELSELKIALSFLACFLKCLEYSVPYVFLPMKIIVLNYSPWHAAMAVATMGIGDLLGRLFVSAVGSIGKVDNTLFFSIVLLFGGATEVTSGLLSNYHALCACGFFTAACSGMFVAIRPPMLVDLAGISRVGRIFGLMNVGDGLGNLAGLPVLALLHRCTGNINVPFFTCSIGPVVASFLMFAIYIINRRTLTKA